MGAEQERSLLLDLSHIDYIRGVFAASRIKETDPTKILSYNPILDRFNYEKRMLEGMSDEERDTFARNIAFQMETNLRERYHVVSSAFDLFIRDNFLYSSFGQQEQLQNMYWRGVEYRRGLGSREQYRELSELIGFVEVTQKELVSDEAIEGTTIIVVSPPGIVTETAYPKNFIDVLRLTSDKVTNQKKIHATRFTSSLSYDAYAQVIQELQPDFFYKYNDSIPLDAWYLLHPIKLDSRFEQFTPNEVFTSLFRGDPSAMKNEEFLSVVMKSEMRSLIEEYIKRVKANEINPEAIVLSYHAILNYGDSLVKRMKNKRFPVPDAERHEGYDVNVPSIEYWGRQRVMALPAGCGFSGGFSFGTSLQEFLPKNALEQFFGNSVGQFGSDSFDYKNDPNLCRCGGNEPHFHCPGKSGSCGHVIVVGKGISICPACGQGKTC